MNAEDSLFLLARDTLGSVYHYSLSMVSASGTYQILKEWRHTSFEVVDFDILHEDAYLLTRNSSQWYPQNEIVKLDLNENTTERFLLNFPTYDFYPISLLVPSQESLFILTHNPGTGNTTIFSFDVTGEVLWNYTTSNPGIEYTVLRTGELIVLDDESIQLIDSEGVTEWRQAIGPSTDSSTANWYVNSVLSLEDDSILICCNMFIGGTDQILRFQRNGSLMWSKSISGTYPIGGISDIHIDTMLLSSNNSIFLVADVLSSDANPFLVSLSEDGTSNSGWGFKKDLWSQRLMADSYDNPILLGIERNQYNSSLYVYHYDPSTALPPLDGYFFIGVALVSVGIVAVVIVFFVRLMAKKKTTY